jgi:FkbM family methyltransferase
MLSRVVLLALLGCVSGHRLRNASSHGLIHNHTLAVGHSLALHAKGVGPSCACQATAPAGTTWAPPTRTAAKCIFIDLGAANANSFQQFMEGHYGPVQNCPSGGQWEAYLVEANPQFTPALETAKTQHPGQVVPFAATAAYSCKGTTSFSIDPDAGHNHWGSSMKKQFDGSTLVTVPTVNVMELIATTSLQADWVMLKVDIEGAEFDLIPCLANSPSAHLIDRMYLEEHTWLNLDSVYTQEEYQAAKQKLVSMGVDIPAYFSHTL